MSRSDTYCKSQAIVDVVLCGGVAIPVDLGGCVFFEISSSFDGVTDDRLLFLVRRMASDNAVDDLVFLYGRVDAVVHSARSLR